MSALPVVRQESPLTCGAASLKCVLLHFGVEEMSEESLAQKLGTDGEGTEPEAIARVARDHRLWALHERGLTVEHLREYLLKGSVPIVSFQAWPTHAECSQGQQGWKDEDRNGHYAPVQEVTSSHIVLMDPSVEGGQSRIEHEEFLRCWHDVGEHEEKLVRSAIIVRQLESAEGES